MLTEQSDLQARAAVHRALGEPHRLAIVDALWLSDRSPSELREVTGLSSNLLSFHLDALEHAGLIDRQTSQGDARRRFVRLHRETVMTTLPESGMEAGTVLFVCTHNSARSQMAAALWRQRTGEEALSAGTEPAPRVHPLAVEVARHHGVDLGGRRPQGYDDVATHPDLVVSVCDRARETALPWSARHLHWSVPDPAGHDLEAFEEAFTDLQERVSRLAAAVRSAA